MIQLAVPLASPGDDVDLWVVIALSCMAQLLFNSPLRHWSVEVLEKLKKIRDRPR
jgi:hypothetical protein